jgi:hypothetical protein
LRRAIWQCVAAGSGVGLGMVLNPYFPGNLQFMYTQVFETGLGAPEDVGSEWKTFDGWNLLLQSVPLALVWLWCLTRRLQTAVAANSGEIALLLLNVLFLVLTLKARRFVEYWPVFAMLNAASFYAVSRLGLCKAKSSADQLSGVSTEPGDFRSSGHHSPTPRGGAPNEPGENLRPNAGSTAAWPGRLVFTVLAVAAAINLAFTRSELNVSHDVPAIREAMDFMREYSDPGSLILTDDWDSFPTCFYSNHHNYYAVGLDPEFTRTRYPALWERYRRITRAELPATVPAALLPAADSDSPSLAKAGAQGGQLATIEPCTDRKIRYEDIATCFGAAYVLVAEDHRKLYKALLGEPDEFTPIYPPGTTTDSPQAAITIFAVSRGE